MNVEAPCLSATRPIPACEAVIKLAINSGSSKSCVPESTLCDNNGQIVQSCLQLNSGGIGAESSKIADCRAGCQTGVALCLIAQPLGQFNEFLKTKKTKKSLLDWNFFFCFVFCFLKTDRTNEPTKLMTKAPTPKPTQTKTKQPTKTPIKRTTVTTLKPVDFSKALYVIFLIF